MGIGYNLVNETKKEFISFCYLDGSKMRELAGSPAQSAIVTWYMLQNIGDNIQFVSDTNNDWPFSTGSKDKLGSYIDKTEVVLNDLIENDILEDFGKSYVDEEDPDNVYIRDIRNVWKA